MAVAELKYTTYVDMMDALSERGTLKLAHNTYAYELSNGSLAITYHGSKIAELSPSSLTIMTAGWPTASTIGRLNQLTRANGGGSVGIVLGSATYTDRRGGGKWYPLRKIGVTLNTETGKPFSYDQSTEHNGWSNYDTWATVATLENISETVANMLPELSRADLRELVKSYRREIGYTSITLVNIDEIYSAVRSEN